MDSEKCHAFLTVLERGTLSAAAAELGYTTSGLSRLIASMEQETGFSLLRRDRTGVTLTDDGARLLPLIEEMERLGSYYDEMVQSIRGVLTGRVTIGTAYPRYYGRLAEAIASFHEVYPGVVVEIIEERSSALVQALHEHRIQGCFVSERPGTHRFAPIADDPLLALLPPDHPKAGEQTFPAKDFEKEPFIAILPKEETDNVLYFREHGIRPNVRFSTASENNSVSALVKAGLGITAANASLIETMAEGLVTKPLDPPKVIRLGFAFLDPRENSPAAAAFLDFALPILTAPEGADC